MTFNFIYVLDKRLLIEVQIIVEAYALVTNVNTTLDGEDLAYSMTSCRLSLLELQVKKWKWNTND